MGLSLEVNANQQSQSAARLSSPQLSAEREQQSSNVLNTSMTTTLSLGPSPMRVIADTAISSGTISLEIASTPVVDTAFLSSFDISFDPDAVVAVSEDLFLDVQQATAEAVEAQALALQTSAQAAAAINPGMSMPTASASTAVDFAGNSSVSYGADYDAIAQVEANFEATTGRASPQESVPTP